MKKTQLVQCSFLLLLGACGTAAPAESEEANAVTGESRLPAEDGPRLPGFVDGLGAQKDAADGESLKTVDKSFIDDSLSCNALPSLTCPNITMSAANGSIELVQASDPRFDLVFQRKPAVVVNESLPARPGQVSLNSISCNPQSGSIVFQDVFQFRLPVETQAFLTPDPRTIQFATNVFPSNYPGGTMSSFTCLPRGLNLTAPGFRSQAPQFQGTFVGSRMVTDAQTLNDGQGNFEITCEYTLGGASLAADRPRDVLDSNSSQFVTAASLSASQTQLRCNAICFNDCSVSFGADALGAQNCTDICTPDCVKRATTNTDQCPVCNACSQASDCGSPADFNCTSGGCCIGIIR